MPAQEQTRLRSPKTLSMRLTYGQNLWSRRDGTAYAACLAGVGVVPFVGGDHVGGVRGVFEEVVLFVGLAGFDGGDFGVDLDHGVAEAIQLGEGFAFGWLNHHGAGDGPRDGGRVEAIVHETLGDVLDSDGFKVA